MAASSPIDSRTSPSSARYTPPTPPEDLSIYFYTILSHILPEPGQPMPNLSSAIEQLKAQEGLLILFHEKTPTALKQPIHRFVQEQRLPSPQVQAFHQVVQELYPVSLLNSFTNTALEELKGNIQKLYLELQHDGKLNPSQLKFLNDEASALLEAPTDSPPEELEARLKRMAELTALLTEYHTLRKYIDPIQSQRMLDLANELDEEEYHTFLTLYPKVMDVLKANKERLDTAFIRSEALFHAGIRIRSQIAEMKGESRKPDVRIQIMLLLYDDSFIEATYPLLWNALQARSPSLQGAYSPDKRERLSVVLRENCPHFKIDSWIPKILEQLPSEELSALKDKLDPLYYEIGALHKEDVTGAHLNLAIAPLKTRMERICFDAICDLPLDFDAILAGG
ncbi:MAG: hypothetical protein V4492_09190 [Chlamydiota bacterium]